MSITVDPDNATDKDVTFEIDVAEGLTVSDTGRIEWTEETPFGVYTTTVTTMDGNFTDTHTLTLNNPGDG